MEEKATPKWEVLDVVPASPLHPKSKAKWWQITLSSPTGRHVNKHLPMFAYPDEMAVYLHYHKQWYFDEENYHADQTAWLADTGKPD